MSDWFSGVFGCELWAASASFWLLLLSCFCRNWWIGLFPYTTFYALVIGIFFYLSFALLPCCSHATNVSFADFYRILWLIMDSFREDHRLEPHQPTCIYVVLLFICLLLDVCYVMYLCLGKTRHCLADWT